MAKKNPDDPPKFKHGRLLNRIAAKSKKRLTGKARKKQPPERLNRWAKWWEWRLIGMSVAQIQKREENDGKSFSIDSIKMGLDKYADLCADDSGRARRMVQHKSFVDQLRFYASTRVRQIIQQNDRSGGKGIPVESTETKYDANRNIVDTVDKTTHELVDRSMVQWMRFALELDRYSATIDGLLTDVGAGQNVEEITVDVSGFIGTGELEFESSGDVEIEIEPEPKKEKST